MQYLTKTFFVWRYTVAWFVLKNVERKHKNVKAASTVRVKANTVFKRERKVFILLLEDQVFQKLVDISLDSGTGGQK